MAAGAAPVGIDWTTLDLKKVKNIIKAKSSQEQTTNKLVSTSTHLEQITT